MIRLVELHWRYLPHKGSEIVGEGAYWVWWEKKQLQTEASSIRLQELGWMLIFSSRQAEQCRSLTEVPIRKIRQWAMMSRSVLFVLFVVLIIMLIMNEHCSSNSWTSHTTSAVTGIFSLFVSNKREGHTSATKTQCLFSSSARWCCYSNLLHIRLA